MVTAEDAPVPRAIGHIRDFARILAESGAGAVVLCGYLPDEQFREVIDASLAGGCQVLAFGRLGQVGGLVPRIVWRQGRPVVELTTPSLEGWQRVLKRVTDLLGATVGLVLLAPLFALIAIAVRVDSPGPVLFGQERIGAGGRRFRLLKFRSMGDAVSESAHREFVLSMLREGQPAVSVAGRPVYKLVGDPRVTRVGRILRRTSLDELPQLVNVLRGEMSLVGPRPPLPYELEEYDRWQYERLQVPPGMTGLWQVSGRNLLSYHEMCQLDIRYIAEWSLWLDLRIMIRTVPVVLVNSGRTA
jgi:exopolysaccharide biosynthesis polyprenyl glycosylphosphotransferase